MPGVRERCHSCVSVSHDGLAVELTESETEYMVKCTKHIFQEHVVFEFVCTNTLNDQRLENVTVTMEGGEQEVDEEDIISVGCPMLEFEKPASTFVAIPLDCSIATQTFDLTLEFTVRDCDPETGEVDEEGYADTYVWPVW